MYIFQLHLILFSLGERYLQMWTTKPKLQQFSLSTKHTIFTNQTPLYEKYATTSMQQLLLLFS
jgi:hypothetical protein